MGCKKIGVRKSPMMPDRYPPILKFKIKEIYREKIPTLIKSISSSPSLFMALNLIKVTIIRDIIIKAA